VFGQRTWIGPPKFGFYEQVAKGSFARSIASDTPDAAFLYDHDSAAVLARQSAGNLELREDKTGLAVSASPPPDDVDWMRLQPKLRAGTVSQMSFGFEVLRDSWETVDLNDDGAQADLRTLEEVRLWEVSAVTFPAYPQTDAGLRAQAFDVLASRLGMTTTKRSRLFASLAGDEVDEDALSILREASVRLDSLVDELSPEPPSTSADESGPEPPSTRIPLTLTRKRLALVASRHGFDL
jgi:HK97 family phage prohead protease